MSIFEKYPLKLVKNLLKATVYRPGKTVTIRRGGLKGCRYIVNENSGWAPIYGGWEPNAVKLFRHFVKQGNTVFDLGANCGIHSLLFSKLVGKTGKVLAFEPLRENVEEIKSIIRLNQLSNIQIVGMAVGNQLGFQEFKLGRDNKAGSLIGIGKESGKVSRIEVITLDYLMAENFPKPDFIKMDVEGAESMVLAGGVQTIRMARPVLYIELHTPDEDVRVGKFLKEHHYAILRPVFSLPGAKEKFRLEPIQHYDQGWPDPQGVYGDILALPNPEWQIAS